MKIAGTVQNWLILCPGELKDRVSTLVGSLKMIASRSGRITGRGEELPPRRFQPGG
jgi:hypothetical protein